jgi:hypothetical protein
MQKDLGDVVPQPETASFEHYGRGVEGGKPTYNMKPTPEQDDLYSPAYPEHKAANSNCQRCYVHDAYIKKWGSEDCTNVLADGNYTVQNPPDVVAAFKAVHKLPDGQSGQQFKCLPTPRDADLCGTWIKKEHCDASVNKYRAVIAESTCPSLCGKC